MNGESIIEAIIKLLVFKQRLSIILFGENYQERMTPDQLTDEKLLEAVRMLREVY